jgi:nucleotide-binding universal stress UspA family protein
MTATKTILVAINDSDASREAVEVGVSLAASQGAGVMFLHVIPHLNGARPADDAALRNAAARASAVGVPVATQLTGGDVAMAILSCAEAVDARLIVIGAGGRNLLKHRVSAAVTRRSSRPVLVARGVPLRQAA